MSTSILKTYFPGDGVRWDRASIAVLDLAIQKLYDTQPITQILFQSYPPSLINNFQIAFNDLRVFNGVAVAGNPVQLSVTTNDLFTLPLWDSIRSLMLAVLAAQQECNPIFSFYQVSFQPNAQLPVELQVSTEHAHAGDIVGVKYSLPNPSNPSDWVGLIPVGAPNQQYVQYLVVPTGTTTGRLMFTLVNSIAPGTYVFKYLPNNGYIDVASSLPLVVT